VQCLVDEDVTIRLRALELITGMVTRRNLPDIVKRLLELLETAEVRHCGRLRLQPGTQTAHDHVPSTRSHASFQGHFRDELIEKVVFMCSRDKFAYLADFAWYISVLVK
jgi:AP-3 complex subunit delta